MHNPSSAAVRPPTKKSPYTPTPSTCHYRLPTLVLSHSIKRPVPLRSLPCAPALPLDPPWFLLPGAPLLRPNRLSPPRLLAAAATEEVAPAAEVAQQCTCCRHLCAKMSLSGEVIRRRRCLADRRPLSSTSPRQRPLHSKGKQLSALHFLLSIRGSAMTMHAALCALVCYAIALDRRPREQHIVWARHCQRHHE